MIVIMLGADGAGKSTLARKICSKIDLKYIKKNKPETQEEINNMLQDYLDDITGENIIYDRCIYCEYVYGNVMRNGSAVTLEDIATFEEKVKENGGGIIIHCTDETKKLWERCNKRGEDYVTSYKQLDNIRNGYYQLLEHSTLPIIEYTVKDWIKE